MWLFHWEGAAWVGVPRAEGDADAMPVKWGEQGRDVKPPRASPRDR